MYGGALIRPLVFEFPSDPQIYNYIDTEFFFGSSILVAPVLS